MVFKGHPYVELKTACLYICPCSQLHPFFHLTCLQGSEGTYCDHQSSCFQANLPHGPDPSVSSFLEALLAEVCSVL